MTKFFLINLTISLIILCSSINLAADVTILPKSPPNKEVLIENFIIIPKSQPKIDSIETQKKNNEIEKKELDQSLVNKELISVKIIFPKYKPILDEKVKLEIQKKVFLLPSKKPLDKTSEEKSALKKKDKKI